MSKATKSKLGIVIRHEYLTIVKRPAFWIAMIAIPLLIGVIQLIAYIGNSQGAQRINELSKDLKDVAIIDRSGLINESVVSQAGFSLSGPSTFEATREYVRTGEKEALIVYPDDVAETKKYDIYLSTNDFTKNGSVNELGDSILESSIFAPLGSSDVIALARDGGEARITTYHNGTQTAGINEYVIPGLIAVLFFLVLFFSVGYMLTSVAEEKENRSIEMVMTYVTSRTLIVGKLLAVSLVTLTQLTFLTTVTAAVLGTMYLLGNDFSFLAGLELDKLVYDPVKITFGLGFLLTGFLMYAGFMVITAAAAPNAREANSFSGIFFVGAFSPFWFIMLILTDPENVMTRFATFFPLTSPMTTLIRNAIGNISITESLLALIVMIIFAVLSIALAVRIFRVGALEIANRVRLKSLFSKS